MANNDASSDANIDIKKRARRRLVGASALALLGVVVLSVTMEHSPGPRQGGRDGPEILIPSQSGRETLSARPAPAPLPSPPVEPQGSSADGASAPPAEAKLAVATVKPVDPVKPEAAAAKPGQEKPATPAAKSMPEPDKGSQVKKAEEAKAVAALEDKAGGQWVVQLGAYQSAGNVKLLLSKLKEMGVPAYTEKFDSPQGHRTRVRAGPFASREEADKAQVKIRIIRVPGTVAQKQ